MSLVRIALRQCAVKALQGMTLAGSNVLDSKIGVLGEDDNGVLVSEKNRFIAVYTEEGVATPDSQRVFHENGRVHLSIEFGVTSSMVVVEPDPNDPEQKIQAVIPGIPFTDRLPEIYLDILGRQIRDQFSGGQSDAAKILKSLIIRVDRITCERAGSERDGEKVAAMKLTFVVQAIDDPQRQEDAGEGTPLHAFFALLDVGDDDDQRLANLMRAQIPVGADSSEDEARARIGLTLSELQALGFSYFEGADDDTTVDTVTLNVAGVSPVEVP